MGDINKMDIYRVLHRDNQGHITTKAIQGKNKIKLIDNSFKSIEVKKGFFNRLFYGVVIVLKYIKNELNK